MNKRAPYSASHNSIKSLTQVERDRDREKKMSKEEEIDELIFKNPSC